MNSIYSPLKYKRDLQKDQWHHIISLTSNSSRGNPKGMIAPTLRLNSNQAFDGWAIFWHHITQKSRSQRERGHLFWDCPPAPTRLKGYAYLWATCSNYMCSLQTLQLHDNFNYKRCNNSKGPYRPYLFPLLLARKALGLLDVDHFTWCLHCSKRSRQLALLWNQWKSS